MAKDKKSPAKKSSQPKKVNVYQQFMKKEIKAVKSAKPSLSHKEAFTLAAKNWKSAPENPNKGK